jgi:hypothetical protein
VNFPKDSAEMKNVSNVCIVQIEVEEPDQRVRTSSRSPSKCTAAVRPCLQLRASSTRSAPDRVNEEHTGFGVAREVDVVLRLRHQELPNRLAVEDGVDRPERWGDEEERYRRGKLASEEVTSIPMFTPPRIAGLDMLFGFGCEPSLHPRASSLPSTTSASITLPAFA